MLGSELFTPEWLIHTLKEADPRFKEVSEVKSVKEVSFFSFFSSWQTLSLFLSGQSIKFPLFKAKHVDFSD